MSQFLIESTEVFAVKQLREHSECICGVMKQNPYGVGHLWTRSEMSISFKIISSPNKDADKRSPVSTAMKRIHDQVNF